VGTRPDLADLLTDAAREIHSRQDLDSTLAAVVGCLHACLPTPHHVGVSLAVRDDLVEARSASDEVAQELDRLQHSLGEGPALDVLTHDPVITVHDLQHEQRWSSYVPLAVDRGVRALLAVRLASADRVHGSLSVYSTTDDTIDPLAERITTLFASHAALAVERSRREDGLESALLSRTVIGQAVGLVMERFALDEELAFRYLVRLSSNKNVKLREIARELVTEANARPRESG
jgi:GAF domain-containing protein